MNFGAAHRRRSPSSSREYRLELPGTYRQFLARMGHSAGKLFAYDHVNCYYPAVTEYASRLTNPRDKPVNSPDEETYLREVTLPDRALVIVGRLDEQFHFIVCEGGEDAPVFYFSEEGEPPEQIYASVLDWLEDWRHGAEEAISSGYFERK